MTKIFSYAKKYLHTWSTYPGGRACPRPLLVGDLSLLVEAGGGGGGGAAPAAARVQRCAPRRPASDQS